MIGRNGGKIARVVLRDSIVALPPVQSLVPASTGVYKVFWEHVNDTIPLPYITFSHFSGGYEKDRRYWEAVYEIKGHTANIETADLMEQAIDALDYTWPNTASYPQVCGYDTIDSMLPMFTRYVVKNNSLFVVSMLYRLRLNLGDLV